jgi:hypothetical protein
MKSGSCLCGAVRYEIDGDLKQVVGCHCGKCRKWTGHFLTFTAAWHDELRLTRSDGLAWFESSPGNRRGFCKTCGSNLFFVTDGDDKTSISAGSIDGATGLQLVAHIFAPDKGDYYAIDPGQSQHVRGGDGVSMPAKNARKAHP